MEGEEEKVVLKKGKIWLIVIAALVVAIGLGGYFVFGRKSNISKSNVPVTSDGSSDNSSDGISVRWAMNSDGSYKVSGTAPACPSPLVLPLPTDITKVVSVLYPGQYRGTDYKPHGGLRFADSDNNQTVTAPLDASVVDGGRYTVNGEVQYMFDFVNSCGIKYRLGHLRTLSPAFAALAEKFPSPQEMDSRTNQINPPAQVKAGDAVATAVGLLGAGNAFFDYGLFDLRHQNEASKSTVFQSAHSNDKDLAWHGICWLDYLSADDTIKVKALPATSPGSMSDYCVGATPATDSSSPVPASANDQGASSGGYGTGTGGGNGGGRNGR